MWPMSAKLYRKNLLNREKGPGHYSPMTDQYPVIDVLVGGHNSPVNNVRGVVS